MFISKKPKPDSKVFSNQTHILLGGIIGSLSSLVSIGVALFHKIDVNLMKKLFSLIPLILSIKMIFSLL
jgi:cadmium resistance protein CadD (predicted permease)